MASENRQARALISGMVQGVGFRQATQGQANALGLGGWVRNLSGGGVEAVFFGEEPGVQRMLDWCKRGPILSRVDRVDVTWEEVNERCSGFEIRF